MNKYFKPTSLTWWTGIASIIGGLFHAYQTKDFVGIAQNPAVLGGLAAIGIRGAIN